MELNFSPKPVSVTTPTMMPAAAQVAATFSTPMEPPSMALMKRFDSSTSVPRTWLQIAAASPPNSSAVASTVSQLADSGSYSVQTTHDSGSATSKLITAGLNGNSAQSRFRKLTASATIVAQNTDSTGENPTIMKTVTATSERK